MKIFYERIKLHFFKLWDLNFDTWQQSPNCSVVNVEKQFECREPVAHSMLPAGTEISTRETI